ncbi:hypothetical protein PQX77_014105 [Marasmius sp. AFHP31]|nr:hypothetical protein PQX77_014105 [Marasmius sp. AFHP31]
MEDKPLPAIPSRPSHLLTVSTTTTATSKKKATRETPHAHKLTTLCLKAREHRNRFIRFVLDEASQEEQGQESAADVGWLERNKDEVVWAIEDALDDLGKSMGQGGWLVGIRRAKSVLGDEEHQEDEDKIRQLRDLAAQPNPPTPLPVSKHLLLCLAPVGSRVALPEEDSGFDIIPTQIQCTFKPGVFAFPDQVQGSVLLYGCDEWSCMYSSSTRSTSTNADHIPTASLLSSTTPLRLVGGTFQFASVPGSSSFHAVLSKVIKLTVYQHLSLLLEQHLWADAGVPLTFPSPSFISTSRSRTIRRPSGLRNRVLSHGATSALQRPKLGEHKYSYDEPPPSQQPKPQPSSSKGSLIPLPNGILSFFSKRSLGRSHSPKSPEPDLPITTTASSSSSRGASLDIRSSPTTVVEQDVAESPIRSSIDSSSSPSSANRNDLFGGRIRRFSFSSSAFHSLSPTSTLKPQSPPPPPKPKEQQQPFTTLLNRLTESKELFSTSPGVGKNIDLPSLLVKLAERERESGSPAVGMKIRGDERVALKELLGWDDEDRDRGGSSSSCASHSKSTPGAGMLGTKGFLKHQSLTVLASVHVPRPSPNPNSTSSDGEDSDSEEDSVEQAIQDQQSSDPTSKAPSPQTSPQTASITSISTVSKSMPKRKRKPRPRPGKYVPCANTQPPRWETFIFSTSTSTSNGNVEGGGGPCLGEMIRDWLEGAERACIADTTYGNVLRRTRGMNGEKKREKKDDAGEGEASLCKMKRGNHEVRFIHGGVRVTVVVSEMDPLKQEREREREPKLNTGAKSSSSSSLGLAPTGSQSLTAPAPPTTTRAQSDTEAGVKEPQQGKDGDKDNNDGPVEMWTSCAVCEKDNWGEGRVSMSDGTFLLPFGKFLELLIYSPSLCTMDSPLCEHTATAASQGQVHERTNSLPSSSPPPPPPNSSTSTVPPPPPIARAKSDEERVTSPTSAKSKSNTPFGRISAGVKKSSSLRNPAPATHHHPNHHSVDEDDNTPTPTPSRIVSVSKTLSPTETPPQTNTTNNEDHLPPTRFNLVRNFSNRTHTVSFSLDRVDEVFELRVPRVQIVRGVSAVLGSGLGFGEVGLGGAGGGGVKENEKEKERMVEEEEEEEEKKKLRREIKVWWEGVGDYVDVLETRLADTSNPNPKPKKSLPRLPSSDDAYDDFDSPSHSHPHPHPHPHPSGLPTPRPRPKPEGLPLTPTTPTSKGQHHYFQSRTDVDSEDTETSKTPTGTPKATTRPALPSTPSTESLTSLSSSTSTSTSTSTSSSHKGEGAGTLDPTLLLSNLRQTFHRTEQSLYTQLSQTPPSSLNLVRRSFLSAARGVERRLGAWQKKHVGVGLRVVSLNNNNSLEKDKQKEKEKEKEKDREKEKESGKLSLYVTEPKWWHKSCHVVPGGNIIVREDDWGSIIAFTLSTDAFKAELGAMSGVGGGSRPPSIASEAPSTPPTPSTQSSSSFFSAAAGYRLFRTSAASQPDPDQEDVIWHEPEAYSAVISRKEHPRDPSGLLSIREVLRQKAPGTSSSSSSDTGASGILSGSRIATLGREGSRLISSALGAGTGSNTPSSSAVAAPPSAWSKPDVKISKEAVGGEVVSGLPGSAAAADKIIQELDAATSGSGLDLSRPGSAMSNEPPWTSSFFGDAHIKRGKAPSILSIESTGSDAGTGTGMGSGRLSLASAAANKGSYLPPPPVPVKDAPTTTTTPASSGRYPFSTLALGNLTTAMRAMLHNNNNPDAISRPHSSASTSSTSTKHHGLLSADIAPIDDRPHIKYDWTVGKRLKFSCTAYYAKQFDILRKRCGVDNDTFLRSLSQSQNWSAEGGKSRSNFWKTRDERFIIKTLVNAWNVADLQVLIDLAPSYFRYLDSTASKATVLAKLVGFYTIEIRNLETGTVQSKADLLVMENLFYNQTIDKTFDLKGIQGRKVKAGGTGTLFDGEWIEGQQQTLTLVRPHSKVVLREAIRSDAEFLARSNIMDYSLLLGVDTKSKEIACGLVDTIGSYTFAKTLEYKAKQGLSAGGKEVTVVPPNEYQERFVSALERYFLACPDKWSKPLDADAETRILSDLNSLSNVL